MKQFEPLTCIAAVIAEPAWLMPPAKVRGGFPETLDDALNCQLPATFGVGTVTGDDVTGEGGTIGAGCGAPPHPKRRTVAERVKSVGEHFMSFLPELLGQLSVET